MAKWIYRSIPIRLGQYGYVRMRVANMDGFVYMNDILALFNLNRYECADIRKIIMSKNSDGSENELHRKYIHHGLYKAMGKLYSHKLKYSAFYHSTREGMWVHPILAAFFLQYMSGDDRDMTRTAWQFALESMFVFAGIKTSQTTDLYIRAFTNYPGTIVSSACKGILVMRDLIARFSGDDLEDAIKFFASEQLPMRKGPSMSGWAKRILDYEKQKRV